MIEFVRGKTHSLQPGRIVVDLGAVGLAIDVPTSLVGRVGGPGEAVELRTHLLVREDALQLVGFESDIQKQMFLSLTSVSGIGPKVALKLLGEIEPSDLAGAIVAGDIPRLTRLPGVGKKTAEVLVAHLRDAMGKSRGLPSRNSTPALSAAPAASGGGQDALLALQALGADPQRARSAMEKALADHPEIAQDTSRLVAESLRRL